MLQYLVHRVLVPFIMLLSVLLLVSTSLGTATAKKGGQGERVLLIFKDMVRKTLSFDCSHAIGPNLDMCWDIVAANLPNHVLSKNYKHGRDEG